MAEIFLAIAFMMTFAGCVVAGMWLQRRLRDHHKSRDTVDSVRLIVSMVVTFSAIVLGLLITSAKSGFDEHTAVYRQYGIALVELDRRLVEYGPEVDPIRRLLRAYTAAVFVLNWPTEPSPAGEYPTVLHPVTAGSDEISELTALMAGVDAGIQRLDPADQYHRNLAALLQNDVRNLESVRWTVIERARSRLSTIFVGMLVGWLSAVFFVFGLVSPRNGLVVTATVFCGLSVSTALYLVIDLDTSLTGSIVISSRPLKDALWHMDQARGP